MSHLITIVALLANGQIKDALDDTLDEVCKERNELVRHKKKEEKNKNRENIHAMRPKPSDMMFDCRKIQKVYPKLNTNELFLYKRKLEISSKSVRTFISRTCLMYKSGTYQQKVHFIYDLFRTKKNKTKTKQKIEID